MMLKNDELRRSEHNAVRNNAGYYDFTHQLLEVTGEDAPAFLDRLYVNAIGTSKIGTAKYTTMLNNDGQIIDDVIVFRIDEKVFHISTLYINELIAWMDKNREGFNVEYKDITPVTTMYAVQGPESRKLLNRFLAENIDDLPFYGIRSNKIGDTDVRVARSGFTGELGYEIYCTPEKSSLIEAALVENGKDLGLVKITTDIIIGSLPREKGYVLMSDIGGANPYEVGFGWTVSKKKDFIGKAATDALLAEGIKRELLGFELEEEAEVNPEDKVYLNGECVGKVTCFTYGYTVEKYIGFAMISAPAKVGDKVEIGEQHVKAAVVERVWYDKENARTRKA